jgi:hypothetical protein
VENGNIGRKENGDRTLCEPTGVKRMMIESDTLKRAILKRQWEK